MSKEPELEHHVIADLAARLAKAERALEEAKAEIERMTPQYVAYDYLESPAGREMAESRVSELEQALEEAEKVIANERRRATDAEYMAQAYRNMLGETGMKVANMWRDKGIRRVHFSWAERAEKLTGEERAKHILEWEYAPSREVDPREIDGASPTVSVEEFVSGMESRHD